MGKTSYVRSLMEFNRRVLAQGTPNHSDENRAETLHGWLFFNRIFLTNTQEMFERFNVSRIQSEYKEMIRHYLRNVNQIQRMAITYQIHPTIRNEIRGLDALEGMEQYERFIRSQLYGLDRLMKQLEPFMYVKVHEVPEVPPIHLRDIFSQDYLLEYPKDSFDVYLSLLQAASMNPHVKFIAVSIYRIGKDPSIFNILKQAIWNGIKVQVHVETRARGDEAINRMWEEQFRSIGAIVTTSIPIKNIRKVHSKLTLIEFDDGKMILQIGTGNYHSETTRQYTDLSLLTSDRKMGKTVKRLYRWLRNEGKGKAYEFPHRLLLSPGLRLHLLYMITQQTELKSDGYIAIKCNALDDDEVIDALIQAAQAGCTIDLIIRGVCTWVPGDEFPNVHVRSIIWDKLEHSRVYCFGKINPELFIGSLDLVTHKMDHRIEVLAKVKDPDIIVRTIQYLNRYITNPNHAWIQLPSGAYQREV